MEKFSFVYGDMKITIEPVVEDALAELKKEKQQFEQTAAKQAAQISQWQQVKPISPPALTGGYGAGIGGGILKSNVEQQYPTEDWAIKKNQNGY